MLKVFKSYYAICHASNTKLLPMMSAVHAARNSSYPLVISISQSWNMEFGMPQIKNRNEVICEMRGSENGEYLC